MADVPNLDGGSEDAPSQEDGTSNAVVDSGPIDVEGCDACAGTCILARCVAPVPRMPDSANEAPSNGSKNVPCPGSGDPAYGQDCDFRYNVPSFATDDQIAVDTVTGLVWERPSANGDGGLTWDDARAHCIGLADAAFASFGDWRMPTAREAVTLANSAKNTEGLDQTVFTSELRAAIWTSTIPPESGVSAVYLDGNYPAMIYDAKSDRHPGMHCVRGSLPDAGAMSASASGESVDDPSTGLTWERGISPSDLSWLDALTYCNTLSLEGMTDWRLPSYKELWTIVDVTQNSPAIDGALFPATPTEPFWTSSPVGNDRGLAYTVSFATGPANHVAPVLAMTQLHRARCVRGGS
jgi:hypothetical protein